MSTVLRRHIAQVLALAVVVGLGGCGGGDQTSTARHEGQAADRSSEPGLHHIHGLGVSGDTLFIATHRGLWTSAEGETNARRFGSSRQDIMGFSVLPDGHFIGSGHPDPSQTDLPPNLGLIESRDGGRSWTNISLLGQADFHVLRSAGRRVYGVNSADGMLLVSRDRGRGWQRRTSPAAVFDLAIDPRSSQHVVASTGKGVFSSPDAGRTWRPVRDDLGGLLAWPAPSRLYLVGADGAVKISADGGREWRSTGTIGGPPAAFIADGNELYAALGDSTVKRSADGGGTWTLRAAP